MLGATETFNVTLESFLVLFMRFDNYNSILRFCVFNTLSCIIKLQMFVAKVMQIIIKDRQLLVNGGPMW